MLKKVKDLTADEKIMLIQAIRDNEIDETTLNESTLVAAGERDMFLGISVLASQAENSPLNVVYIGPALIELKKFEEMYR